MYTKIIRPVLFAFPPEFVHQFTLGLLGAAGRTKLTRSLLTTAFRASSQKPAHVFGLDFPNPVGLAAGYDKDAQAVLSLATLGFGHIEVGTITPQPQAGNPKPRLFRLQEDQALINRMGFPGRGAAYVAEKLAALDQTRDFILGVNIGKNQDTLLTEAYQDYNALIDRFAPLADYLAINISSPNTVGLRRLQHQEFLGTLLSKTTGQRDQAQDRLGKRLPLLVKLAPDLTTEELDQIIETLITNGIDGVIATNTTIQRENLSSRHSQETGGLSGQPLKPTALRVIRYIAAAAGAHLPVIGVGGITSAQDAVEMLDAGATLVQLYTGLVYQGPGLVKKIIEKTVQ